MILYLCDEKSCECCRSNAKDCKHTADIKHAKNFIPNGCGDYVENELQPAILETTETKEHFADLVKELNGLIDKYINLRAIRFPYIEAFEESRKRVDEVCQAIECAIVSIAKKIMGVE